MKTVRCSSLTNINNRDESLTVQHTGCVLWSTVHFHGQTGEIMCVFLWSLAVNQPHIPSNVIENCCGLGQALVFQSGTWCGPSFEPCQNEDAISQKAKDSMIETWKKMSCPCSPSWFHNTLSNSFVALIIYRSMGKTLWPSACKQHNSFLSQICIELLSGSKTLSSPKRTPSTH